jgi:transposase
VFEAPTDLPDDPAALQAILRAALAEIERLQFQLAGLQRNRFGRRSEKLTDETVQQAAEDLEQSVAKKVAGLEAAAKTKAKPSDGTQPKRNRGALPAHLPRVEVIVDIEAKDCPCCGGSLHQIGEDQAEMLDYVPAQFRVRVIRRPRYGCRARLPKVPSAKPMEWQTRAAKMPSSRRQRLTAQLTAAWRRKR